MTRRTSRIKRFLAKLGFPVAVTMPINHEPIVEPTGEAGQTNRQSGLPITVNSFSENFLDDGGNLNLVEAKFSIGQIVRHKMFPFRGVVFDVDPSFANTEDWYESIPEEARPNKEQPYYHLLAENDKTHYVAYVSEQNLRMDDNADPINHPEVDDIFGRTENGDYQIHPALKN